MAKSSSTNIGADQLENLTQSSDVIASKLNDAMIRLKFVEDFVSGDANSSSIDNGRNETTVLDDSAKQMIRDLFGEMTQQKSDLQLLSQKVGQLSVDEKTGYVAKEDLEKMKNDIKKLSIMSKLTSKGH